MADHSRCSIGSFGRHLSKSVVPAKPAMVPFWQPAWKNHHAYRYGNYIFSNGHANWSYSAHPTSGSFETEI